MFLICTKYFETLNKFKEKVSTVHLSIKFNFNDSHTNKNFLEATLYKPTKITSYEVMCTRYVHKTLTQQKKKSDIRLLNRIQNGRNCKCN